MEPDLPEKFTDKTILVAPVDWGMGHSTRCVPLIRSLSRNNTVVLGVSSENQSFFDLHFPNLEKVNLPSWKVRYSRHLPAYLKVLLQSPRLLSVIRDEHKALLEISSKRKLDIIISDNRFGLFHPDIRSVLIGHQLNLSYFNPLADKLNTAFIHRFNEVWVPDFKQTSKRLSGILSDEKKIKVPVHFIGPLSALAKFPDPIEKGKTEQTLILLSGSEPQRSVLEEKLLKLYNNSVKNVVLIRGTNEGNVSDSGHLKVYNHLYGNELAGQIEKSDLIICRSGYSTLMDLYTLEKKKLILIPTPGQPEQKYLAKYWTEKFGTSYCPQNKIVQLKALVNSGR
jgi:uncharacterized protein (TIGR00661 family)